MATNGVVTFTNLRIDRAGSNYQLIFTFRPAFWPVERYPGFSTVLQTISEPFAVSPGPPAQVS